MKLEGISGWFWISPTEKWDDQRNFDREIRDGDHQATGSATVFFDPKLGGEEPYKHWSLTPEDRRQFVTTLGDDGRLRRKDMAGRWRTVDESGTGFEQDPKDHLIFQGTPIRC